MLRKQSKLATDINESIIQKTNKLAAKSAVLGPCLEMYKSRLDGPVPAQKAEAAKILLGNLTEVLTSSYPSIAETTRERFLEKWKGRHDCEKKMYASVSNSSKRAAGTNFQGLLAYATAHYLRLTASRWYVCRPVPADFRNAIAIEIAADELVTVAPDIDILLRHQDGAGMTGSEPVVLLSAKTSVIDRGGAAARWKLHFDIASNQTCSRELGISMPNIERYDICHAIVTANIYSIFNEDLKGRSGGELASKQTASNTYMFRHKLTARCDSRAVTPNGWRQFESIGEILDGISSDKGLAA